MYLPSPCQGGFSEETRRYEGSYDVKNTEEFVRLHPCAQLGPKQVRFNYHIYRTIVKKYRGKKLFKIKLN